MVAVAIDGPAGAGKSTVAKALAGELGFVYVDTGALYRAIGLYALENGKDPSDAPAVQALLGSLQVSLRFYRGEQCVLLGARDVSQTIRRNDVSMAASAVSAIPAVREYLFALQQDLAKTQNVVMDGRDIGTVVLPWAQIKIFLTASLEERAKRRYAELREKGQEVNFETLLEEMRLRDKQDAERAVAPLKQAADAVLVDTTGVTLEEALQKVKTLVKEKLENGI